MKPRPAPPAADGSPEVLRLLGAGLAREAPRAANRVVAAAAVAVARPSARVAVARRARGPLGRGAAVVVATAVLQIRAGSAVVTDSDVDPYR